MTTISKLTSWLDPHPKLDGISPIDHLFNRFDGLYPHKFRSAFGCERAIENWRQAWAEGLEEERLTTQEIKAGLDFCRKRMTWPPSFAEFIAACRPAVDAEAAFFEAVEQLQLREQGKDKWSHPAIFWTAAKIGAFDMRNATWDSIKSRWSAALKAQLELKEWPPVPPPMLALPSPGKASPPSDEVRRKIETLKAQLAKKMTMQDVA